MVWLHFKKTGQVSSAILPVCKVKKKDDRNKIKNISVYNIWHHYVCRKKYKNVQFSTIKKSQALNVRYDTTCERKLKKTYDFEESSNFTIESTETTVYIFT